MRESLYLALSDFFRFRPLKSVKSLYWFVSDFRQYRLQSKNQNFKVSTSDLRPCLLDKTASTPVEPTYFHQMCWTAEKVFELRPARHVDVGSHVASLGIMSKLVPIEFVDIRPINVSVPSLTFKAGTILDLPYGDNSLESISSICVIEHIGLGRYGDPIDPFGSEKAAYELERITRVGGHLILTVPIDSVSIQKSTYYPSLLNVN